MRLFSPLRLSWLLALLMAISFSKGMVFEPLKFGAPHIFMHYGHGFIKRGLVGQFFAWMYPSEDPGRIIDAFVTLHLLLGGLLIALVMGIFRYVRQAEFAVRDACLWAVFAIQSASLFWPTTAFDCGFLDEYIYVLLALSFLACMRKAYGVAAMLGCIAPLIHESALFVWMPLFLLLAWETWRVRQRAFGPWLPLLAVGAGTVLVFLLHAPHAAELVIQAAPLTDDVKKSVLENQLGQTVEKVHAYMLWKWASFPGNAFLSLAFFGWPTLAMLALYGTMRRIGRADMAVLVIASLAPLSILLVAWDLSRFIVFTNFAALLVIFYWEYRFTPDKRGEDSRAWIAVPLAGVLFFTPLVYTYFELGLAPAKGLFPLERSAYGRWVVQRFTTGYDIPDPH